MLVELFWNICGMQEYAEDVSSKEASRLSVKPILGRSVDTGNAKGEMATIIAHVESTFNYQLPKSGSARSIPSHRQSADAHLGLSM